MIVSAIITTVVAFLLYKQSDNSVILNALGAVALAILLAILGGSGQGLPPQAYFCSWLIFFVGLQILAPLGEGRWPSIWVGNHCVTLTVITVGT